MIPTRTPVPRAPGFKAPFYAMCAALAVGIMLQPQISHSTSMEPRGLSNDLTMPITQIASVRAPQWMNGDTSYTPLPFREEQLNALLSSAVEILTQGEVVLARDTLLGLQAGLQPLVQEFLNANSEMATLPANPCDGASGFSLISCHFATTRSEQAQHIASLRSEIAQRHEQIASERERFAADLQKMGLDIKPEQVSSLLKMATARDIVTLHAVYANLQEINSKLQANAKAEGSTPASIRRYYGMHTVLLEVAMHLHEEIYFRVRNAYLPRVEELARQAAYTYQQARQIVATTNRPELREQLTNNMAALADMLKAARAYHEALTAQAEAVNASWQRLHEQHEVAVNCFRTASHSADLVSQMQESGEALNNLRKLQIPAIGGVGNAALQQEFERLTLEIQLPST